jgi:tetratricopeptide (TPR) repeat protein
VIRHTELDRVSAFLEAGQESALLIAGAYGSGKSRLLEAIASTTESLVYRVRINPKESRLVYSGLSTILAAFRSAEALALSEKLLAQTGDRIRAAALASELLEFYHRTATEPTLLLVDDIDQMDRASQTVITMVMSRLSGSELHMVGTVSAVPLDGALASLTHVGVVPFSFNESLRLLQSLAGPNVDEAVLRMVCSGSDGNPGALLHTFGTLLRKELAGKAPITLPFRPQHDLTSKAVPETNPIAAKRRTLLARLSCGRLTSYAAIVPGRGGADPALENLLGDGTVLHQGDYLRIRDPLLRSRVYWSLDAASRADYHAMAAASEEPHDSGLASLHRSWLDSDSASADELLQAAARFTHQGFVAQGIEFAERVLALDRRACGTLTSFVAFVNSLFLRGELAHADRYTRIGRQEAGDGGTSGALAGMRSQIEFMSTQRLPSSSADDALPDGDKHPSPDAVEDAAVAALHHAERWELEAAKDSLSRIRSVTPPWRSGSVDASSTTVTLAEMLVAALEGDAAPTDRLFASLVRHGSLGDHPERLITLGHSLTFLQEHARARRVFKAILEREYSLDPIWRETTKYALAENEILAGNQLEALAIIDLLNITDSTSRLHQNVRHLLMAWYWQATENHAAAEAAIAECHSSFAAGDNFALSARLECYRGGFALAQGRLDDAVVLLRSGIAYGGGLSIPTLLSYQIDLIEAYVLSGRLAEASAEYDELHAKAALHNTRWTVLAEARARSLISTGEVSPATFQEAIALWSPIDSRFDLGRILMSYGDRLASLGRTREAREQHLAARVLFTQHGALAWARKADAARDSREEQPSAHPLFAMLGTDERRIVVLTCRGLRNKEIAAELFISLRTVEVRLTRIYHKLGVRSRAEMIGAFSGLDTTDPGYDTTEEKA